MKAELQRILELQDQYSSSASPAMTERGELIRHAGPVWLETHAPELGKAVGVSDFFAEGRDGTGRKTRVPWFRFGSRAEAPRATKGFYVVYLFDADGSVVYLSLNQGTTDFVAGEFVPKPANVISERVSWAREALAEWLLELEVGQTEIDLHGPGLGVGYERGNVIAIPYEFDSIPEDPELLAHALTFAEGLGHLYREHAKRPIPHEQPELSAAEEAAERASGNRSNGTRAGFRTNAAEIKLIEEHAVALASTYYEADGWIVRELGKPFDLEIKKAGAAFTVEVKGTTSDGFGVALTAGEVRHHERAFPHNALVVVRGIVLDRNGSTPKASGGTLYELRGWQIDPSALRAISYAYAVPPDIYEREGVPSESLLPHGHSTNE